MARAHGNRKHTGQDSAGLHSGTTHKSKIDKTPSKHGMGSVGKDQKPQANPKTSAPGGHTIC